MGATEIPHQPDGAPRYGEMVTRLPHPAVAAALAALTTVLTDPERSAVDGALACEVADVVSDLIDTQPLMPPLDYADRGADDDAHALRLVCQAVGDLWVAVVESPDPFEKLRAATAARRLLAIAGDRRL